MAFLDWSTEGTNALGKLSTCAQLVLGHARCYGDGSGELGKESLGFRLGHSICLYLTQSGGNGIAVHHFRPFLRHGGSDREPCAQKCDSKCQYCIHDAAADASQDTGKEASQAAACGRAEGADQQAEGNARHGDP